MDLSRDSLGFGEDASGGAVGFWSGMRLGLMIEHGRIELAVFSYKSAVAGPHANLPRQLLKHGFGQSRLRGPASPDFADAGPVLQCSRSRGLVPSSTKKTPTS